MSDAHTESTLEIRLLLCGARDDLRRQRLEEDVTELFERWRAALLRYLSTLGLPHPDSEEIVQEVFLLLFSHLEKDKARDNLRGWLFRVAHNLALKRRHSGKRRAGITADIDSLPHPALNPEEELANSRRFRQFSCILQALPERDRRCICLRAEGLRYREIAGVLGMSLGAVATSLARSLARFERADRR